MRRRPVRGTRPQVRPSSPSTGVGSAGPGPATSAGVGSAGPGPTAQPAWGQQPQQPAWGQQPQQPGWGQPGQGGYAAPPQKKTKKKVWPWVLGGIFLFLLLAFGGCALLISKGVNAVTAPVDASNAWLAAADAGDLPELENLTCGADGTVIDNGTNDLVAAGFDGSKNLNNSSVTNGDATVSGTVGTAAGDQAITFTLSKADSGEGENGWCVDSVLVGF